MGTLSFTIASDLKEYGYTEDGEQFTGELYYIIAEDKDGNRWAHDHAFPGVKVVDTEDFTCFIDIREESKELATKLMDRICSAKLGSVDGRDHWYQIRPAYGSLAYQAYGQYNDWIQERQEG